MKSIILGKTIIKMAEEKRHEMLMHLLINVYSEVLTLKEYVTADIMIRNDHTSREENERFMANYTEKTKEYQLKIIAQLRARYDDTLGNVDDILRSLF